MRSLSSDRQPLRVYGSVFIPSRQLLAQQKFRPWNGVFLSDEYLSCVEAADAITRQVVDAYAQYDVQVLVETNLKNEAEWRHAKELIQPAAGIGAVVEATRKQADVMAGGVKAEDDGGEAGVVDEVAEDAAAVDGAASIAGDMDVVDADRPRKRRRPTSNVDDEAPKAADDDDGSRMRAAVEGGIVENWEQMIAVVAGKGSRWGNQADNRLVPPFDLRTNDHAPLLAAWPYGRCQRLGSATRALCPRWCGAGVSSGVA